MTYEIEVRDLQPQPMVGIRRQVKLEDIQKTLAEVLGKTFGYVMGQGEQPVGPPFSRYWGIDGDVVDLEAGCPTARLLEGEGEIQASELPGGPAAFTWHIGAYDGLPKAYEEVEQWLVANDREKAAPPWEVYWTDPGQEPDPSRWKTEVLQPIRGTA